MSGDPCLFLSLQDLCLLEVINDLDSYPVELLSSLPHWLRYRLLNNLPVLDLCRLHRTPVASGVDTEKIWKSIKIPSICRYPSFRSCDVVYPSGDPFEYDIEVQPAHLSYEHSYILDLEQRVTGSVDRYFIEESVNIPDHDLDFMAAGELCMLKAAFLLLDTTKWTDSSSVLYEKKYRALFEWLISVNYSENGYKGENILRFSRPEQKSMCSVAPMGNSATNDSSMLSNAKGAQITAVAKYIGMNGDTEFAPHRLLKIYKRKDLLELFSFLLQNCGLLPLKNVLNLTLLANNVSLVFPDEDRREKFIHLLKDSLQRIRVLELENEHSAASSDDMCRAIMQGVIGDGKDCQLQHLLWNAGTLTTSFGIGALSPFLCTLPSDDRNPGLPRYKGLTVLELITPLYIGLETKSTAYLNALLQQQELLRVVKLQLSFKSSRSSDICKLFGTLGSLFSRPHFRLLIIDHDDYVETKCSLQLLEGFLTSPCPQYKQKLQYNIREEPFLKNNPLFFKMDVKKIASLDLRARTIPQCSIEHKTFLTYTDIVFEMLLYFPHLRLKQLNLDLRAYADSGQLHNSALHPDLQVANLCLLAGQHNLPVSATDDMRALLRIPTLTRLTASGEYTSHYVLALAQGLAGQAKVGSLRFLTLGHPEVKVSCSESELKGLFDAIFSLPHIGDLELRIMGDELLDALEECQRHGGQIYSSWIRAAGASGQKVKCIKYIGSHFCIKLSSISLFMIALSEEYLKFT